ncbi:MAG TPA: HAD-IA family hydrolase [Candidatus Polarisedimenticolia bacterium]|nr:HAD-IA family hydrolase [Candidatus Polarisedimenticolia bacterium]
MRFEVITFDCYGTLVDWDAGIRAAFLAAAAQDGVSLDAGSVIGAYSRIEPEIEAEPYRPYREVLSETARRVAGELGWNLSPGREAFLAESVPSWPVFPDTNEALLRLSVAGCRLGILSNVDDDLLAATCRHFGVPFDFVITAQQVRAYKPAHAHFQAARQRLGEAAWLHAAQSFFHDVVPAVELGIPVAWINRKREKAMAGDAAPTVELEELARLPSWVEK